MKRKARESSAPKEIEVTGKHFKLRTAAVVALIAVALIAFGIFLFSVLNKDTGWTTVTADNDFADCSDEFVFSYCLGKAGMGASSEYKAVEAIYSAATLKAYRVFNTEEDFSDTVSLHYIFTHPNEEIVVDELLYSALSRLSGRGSRYIYLAPVYDEYYRLFFGYEVAHIVEQSDPYIDGEFAGYLKEISEYAISPEHISLELLGENRVLLRVSEEYKNFASENEITVLLDFFRMKNGFIIDYIADKLISAGHTYGNITSFEGYTRNLDSSQTEYLMNFFDKKGNEIYPAARLAYSHVISAVPLRNYPMGEEDSLYFYIGTNGRIIPPYISEDGLYRSATGNILSYSKSAGCAEILMELLPIYTSDSLDSNELSVLAEKGIHSLWCEEEKIIYTEPEIKLTHIYDDIYTKELLNQ